MARKDINMTEGPILGKMIAYTLPLLLSGVLQILYNAVDVAVVGRYAANSKLALAAVGSTGSLTSLIVGLFMGLSVGSCVVLSQCLGAKDDKGASEVVHTSIFTSFFIGLFLSAVGIIFARTFLGWMNTPDNVIGFSSLYMRIYFAGLPMQMLYNFGSAILRAKGDTRFPLMVLVISGLANVILNLILVIVFHLDVAGVAIATVASQTISAVMVLIHLCRLDDSCKLYFSKLRIHKYKFIRILNVGLPAGIQSVVFAISNVMLQASVNSLGDIAMAGNTAGNNVDGFIYTAQNSVYHAALAFAGQNFGAHKFDRIKKTAICASSLVVGIGIVLGTIALTFSGPLLSIYAPGADNAIVREQGLLRLKIVASTYFLCGLMEVLTGLMRGLGNSTVPMIISMLGACGIRLLWIFFIFPIERFHNLFWLFMSYPISWGLTILAQFIAYRIIFKKVKAMMEATYVVPPLAEK